MTLSGALEVASCTDPGMVRSHNEDSIASDGNQGLVVLADGMGGYNAGEVASGMATTVIITELQQLLEKRVPYEIEDRKSTRLNSSHANISYAVFCLKKKNSNK